MGFLIAAMFLGAFILLLASLPTVANTPPNNQIIVKEKRCPPHQWSWQDIVDQQGRPQGQRMICKICGPLTNSLREE